MPGRKRTGRATNRCREMIALDTEALRAEAVRELERCEARLAEVTAELDRWHGRDRPAQREWVALEFGPLISEIREVEERIRDVSMRLGVIFDFMRVHALSAGAAWRAAERYFKGEGPEAERAAKEEYPRRGNGGAFGGEEGGK